MLPLQILDDEPFDEIMEKARRGINKYYPGWTDYNQHDPGITLIELFSWLKEIQQYHLDQISESSRKKFLKMLGVRQRGIQPARSFVKVSHPGEDLVLAQGTRLQADHVHFETERREYLTGSRITGGYSRKKNGEQTYFDRLLTEGGKMYIALFGERPEAGDAFYIRLDAALPPGEEHHLYLETDQNYAVKRNPPDEDFIPLAQVEWSCYTASGWRTMEVLQDDTRQFILDGRIGFRFDETMAPMPGTGDYLLRVTLLACDYEVAPVLTGIHLTMIPVVQKETLSQYRDFLWSDGLSDGRGERMFTWDTELARWGVTEVFFGRTDGKATVYWEKIEDFRKEAGRQETRFYLREPQPQQELQTQLEPQLQPDGNGLPDRSSDRLLAESDTELLVRLVCFEEAFSLRRLPGAGDGFPRQRFDLEAEDIPEEDFRMMVREAGGFTEWEKREDFDRSGPESRHYVLDTRSGELLFGDCEQGLAPEGEILIVGFARCLGQDGNVKEGRINAFTRLHAATVVNPPAASGGANAESIDEAFLRLRRELRRTERAVTYEDYEELVRTTPGLMIQNCKAIPVSQNPRRDGSLDENTVTLVVQPFSAGEKRELNPSYAENIYRHLADRRLLGTQVRILSPAYVGVRLYAEILVKPYYPDARERIERAVELFFGGSPWAFGRAVLYSAIYGAIDTLDCVLGIRSLAVDAQGKGIRRGLNGDVILPQQGLAYLLEAEYVITS